MRKNINDSNKIIIRSIKNKYLSLPLLLICSQPFIICEFSFHFFRSKWYNENLNSRIEILSTIKMAASSNHSKIPHRLYSDIYFCFNSLLRVTTT
jgi:hypothetical protein